MATIDDTVVVNGWIVVAKGLRTCITTIDIHTLGIVASLRCRSIIVNPSCQVIIAEIEKPVDISLTDECCQDLRSRQVFVLVVHVSHVVGKGNDAAKLFLESTTETGALQELVDAIGDTSIGQADTFLYQVVQVALDIVCGESTLNVIAQMLKDIFPVDTAQLGEVKDCGQLLGNLQKGDVIETERAIGDNVLKLLA